MRRIFLLEWNFVCVYQIIKVVEFSQCIPTHTIRYPIQIIPKTIQSKAICWDKWVWIFWRELTKMTNDSVSPNVKYEYKCRVRRWIGVCVILDLFFLFVYVSSVVSSFDRLFVRSYGVFHFGLGAWMKCARNIITENECIGLNLVPFVYVFALGWNNSTKQSSFLCLLCLRLHTSLVPHW